MAAAEEITAAAAIAVEVVMAAADTVAAAAAVMAGPAAAVMAVDTDHCSLWRLLPMLSCFPRHFHHTCSVSSC